MLERGTPGFPRMGIGNFEKKVIDLDEHTHIKSKNVHNLKKRILLKYREHTGRGTGGREVRRKGREKGEGRREKGEGRRDKEWRENEKRGRDKGEKGGGGREKKTRRKNREREKGEMGEGEGRKTQPCIPPPHTGLENSRLGLIEYVHEILENAIFLHTSQELPRDGPVQRNVVLHQGV